MQWISPSKGRWWWQQEKESHGWTTRTLSFWFFLCTKGIGTSTGWMWIPLGSWGNVPDQHCNLCRMDVNTTWFLRYCIWSTLESLQDGCRYHLVLEVLYLINIANWRGLIVNLFWNPSHLGIGGNEACDQAATRVLKHGCVTQIPLGHSEIMSLAKEQIEKNNTAIPVGHQQSGKLLWQGVPMVVPPVRLPQLSHKDQVYLSPYKEAGTGMSDLQNIFGHLNQKHSRPCNAVLRFL